MATGKRIEGPRAPLFFSTASLALVTVLSSFPANSQAVDVSALEQCIALETEELKLRCFEAIIASSETGATVEATATNNAAATESAEQTTPSTAAGSNDTVVPALTTGTAATSSAVNSRPELNLPAGDSDSGNAVGSPAKINSAPPGTAAEVVAESAPGPSPAAAVATVGEDEVGQEQLARPERQQEADDALIRATVIEVTRGRNDILFFHLDNGQVWRQIEARRYQYPRNREFEVQINRGMMGEYRLRIGDNSPMVRIRRVK